MFVNKSTRFSKAVKDIVKSNPYNISLRQLPKGYGIDYQNKTIIQTTTAQGQLFKRIQEMNKSRLNSIGFSPNDDKILVLNSGNFIDKSIVFKPTGAMKKIGQEIMLLGILNFN